jgi:ABC-type sugar transport system ATPase subunit
MSGSIQPDISGDLILELNDVHKRFGSTRALRGVDFGVRAGEVHALLGQNGSGKSTLMKVAYGELSPTSGRIVVAGADRTFGSPHAALDAGIAAVPQEVPLVDSLTVAENILLGRLPTRPRSRVDWRTARGQAVEVLDTLGSAIDPGITAGRLRPGERQIVAIARALAVRARIVIFDEPTSSLGAERASTLFDVIRELRRRGVGIVFISQRLEDVHEISDRVTVMRDGLVAGELTADEANHEAITELMIGRPLTEYFHKREIARGKAALKIEGLSLAGAFEDISLEVKAGEVVGVAGLVGCGRSEVLRSIYGADARPSGRIEVGGRPFRPRGADASVRAGIGMVTADRKTEGLVAPLSVHENVSMVRNRGLSLKPIRHPAHRRATRRLMDSLQIQARSPDAPVQTLSGGNQQKVVLAKWLALDLKVMLLDEPTRGVDVGAKAEIYRIVSELAEAGRAILVSSSENPELLGICDRILVMSRGRLVGEVEAKTTSEAELVALATESSA